MPVLKPAKIRTRTGDVPLERLSNGQLVWARNAAGRPICNSPKRGQTHNRCQIEVGLDINGRCNRHGGSVPRGINHPATKHGIHSRYMLALRPEWREQFEQLVSDPEYTALKADISIARMTVLRHIQEFAELDHDTIRKLFKLSGEARELLDGEYDETELEETLRELLGLIDGVKEMQAKDAQVQSSQEHLRRLVDTENKRHIAEQSQIPAAKALFLFRYIVECLKGHIKLQSAFLRQYYPEVLSDQRFPDVLRLVAGDIEPLMLKEEN